MYCAALREVRNGQLARDISGPSAPAARGDRLRDRGVLQFSAEEARIIAERRRPELKLGLALQIEEMIERIESLYELRVHERMGDFPDDLLRRHARPAGRSAALSRSAEPAARSHRGSWMRVACI